jgi:tetratricopeptide (TPR) repeat protein
MHRLLQVFFFATLAVCAAVAQVDPLPRSGKVPGKNQPPPRSDQVTESSESSSRDTRIDLSPPTDDAKGHPTSTVSAMADVQEFHPWDPHRALKDIEVGDFYLKRKNYRAALDRYQEALSYKAGDAIANLRMGQCYEKLDQPEDAAKHYEEYLKILPEGPFSEEAKKGLERTRTGVAKGDTEKGK